MPVPMTLRLRPLSAFCRPALYLGLWLGCAPLSFAESREYQVPAGALGPALTRFASQAGVSLSLDPALVNGRQSDGLSGSYEVEEGFDRLLQGSGLRLQAVGEGAYTLAPLPAAGAALQMQPSVVTGVSDPGQTYEGERYAGGQVARRSSQGLLGSKDFMESPLSMITYTSEAVKNQQARTLSDLTASDPAFRSTNPAGGRFEQFTIRGFSLFNSDVSYGGLYGLLPTYSIDMEMADRVDILRGPTQLVNGISPRGSIGGSVNIAPKRATDTPITEFTGSYASDSQVGGALDVGRRFGEDNRFGLRFNGVKQSGDTEWDHQSVDREMAVLGLDYRGDRLRLSADLGHTRRNTNAPQERVLVPSGVPLPDAGKVKHNYAQSWSWADTEDTFGALRGEYDVDPTTLVYAAVGARKSNHDFLRHNVSVSNAAGDFSVQPRDFTRDEDVATLNMGVRKWLFTGPVSHEINLAADYFHFDFDNGGARYASAPSNLYDPRPTPNPGAPTRQDADVHTENRFSGVALSDTLGFFDDQLLLTLGARWQRVQVDDWENGDKQPTAYDEEKLSPSVGVLYKATDQLSLYANYMEGLSQGRIAPSTANNENEIFPPFISRQVEAGAKYDFGRVALTASVFRIKQPAYETADPLAGQTRGRFGPSGKRENTGVELSLFGEPLPGVRLLGGVMYLGSELTGTNEGGANDGKRAPATPRFNANLGAEYDVSSVPGLTLTGRALYTSSQYLDQANSAKIEGWQRYDLGARYAFKVDQTDVTLRGTVENVLDSRDWISAGASDDSAAGLTISAPRTFVLSATLGF